jgi:hypothetical protein
MADDPRSEAIMAKVREKHPGVLTEDHVILVGFDGEIDKVVLFPGRPEEVVVSTLSHPIPYAFESVHHPLTPSNHTRAIYRRVDAHTAIYNRVSRDRPGPTHPAHGSR